MTADVGGVSTEAELARRVAEYLRGSLAMHKVSEIAVDGRSAAFSVEADDGVTRSSVRVTVEDTTDGQSP